MMLIRVLSISVHVAGAKWQIIILRTINIVYTAARRWTVNNMEYKTIISYIYIDGKPRSINRMVQQGEGYQVEFVPLRHGYWKQMPSNGIGGTGKCSQCGESIYGYLTMKYCPNCGARMDGEVK
jgi:hypothetical protein